MRQGIKARGTRSKKRVEGFHNIRNEISRIKGMSKKVVDLNLHHSGRKTKILIQIENGTFSYDDKCIYQNLNLLITKKDRIGLLGPNGAGKTTLINILQEKLNLNSGAQRNADNLDIIVFDQNREQLDSSKTPLEIIGEGNDFVILGNGQKKHINSYLSQFLFTADQINRPISTLSGGEKNRLQLAMFMKQSADIWVFDEPTNDLDIETIELLEREISSYEAAVIVIGHDRAFLDNVCDKVWLINNNEIEIFEGGYTQVAPYLHALEMEKTIPTQEADESKQNIQIPKKIKMTYHEKKRAKVIESDIEEVENKLMELEEQLAVFDFATMNQETQDQYQKLNDDKKLFEDTVSALYKEWEELSSKIE